MLERGLAREFEPAVLDGGGPGARAGARGRRARARRGAQARPARAGDVHDRPAERADFDDAISAEALRRGPRARVGAHRRRVGVRARGLAGRPARRAGGARACTCRERSSRCCRRAVERRVLARAGCRACKRHRRDGPARSAGAAHRVLPLADPLGRAAGLRAGAIASSPAPSAPRSRGREPLAAARAGGGALGRAREQSGRAGARLRGARVRVRRAGQRQRGAHARADRVPPADRAPDDRRQRGGRAPPRASAGMPCLYRVHERPEPARVQRLLEQLASLEVPTPPVPDTMSRVAGGRADAGESRAASSASIGAGSPAPAGRGARPRGADRSPRSCCAR